MSCYGRLKGTRLQTSSCTSSGRMQSHLDMELSMGSLKSSLHTALTLSSTGMTTLKDLEKTTSSSGSCRRQALAQLET